MSKDKNRKVAPKNYVIYGIICILTIVLVFYLSMWYETRQEYYKNNSIMSEFLFEINKQELPNYILENPNSIVYVASSKDELIKPFEKQMKKFILDKEINNQMVYLDIAADSNIGLENELVNLSSKNLKINTIDINTGISFIVFEDSQIKAILHKNSDAAEIEHVKNFFTVYEVIEE